MLWLGRGILSRMRFKRWRKRRVIFNFNRSPDRFDPRRGFLINFVQLGQDKRLVGIHRSISMGTPKLYCSLQFHVGHSSTVELHGCEFTNDIFSFKTISAGDVLNLFPELVGRHPVILSVLFDCGNGRAEPLQRVAGADVAVEFTRGYREIPACGEQVATAPCEGIPYSALTDEARSKCFGGQNSNPFAKPSL